jgi:hypothetical protein
MSFTSIFSKGDFVMALIKSSTPVLLQNHKDEQLKKKIRRLQNEIDFVEILVQFWPWANMANRMERLQERRNILVRESQGKREVRPTETRAAKKDAALPFQSRRFA